MTGANRIASFVMRSPLLWGALVAVGFYTLLDSGQIERLLGSAVNGYFLRYFAGHWVEYIEGTMFFFGLSALCLKLLELGGQYGISQQSPLPPVPTGGQTAADCPELLEHLQQQPSRMQESYLFGRFRAALDLVARHQSADGLDAELKYLSEVDGGKAHASYGLVRIIVWAIPIMGFLGTVIGITMAIANLSPQALEESLPEVTGGLGVAFDTTAVALTQSIVLMFGMFLCDKLETRLLSRVETVVASDLAARFQHSGTGGDPQVAAIRRMAETVVQSADLLVSRQAQLWQASLENAEHRWSQATGTAQQQLEAGLSAALKNSLSTHAQHLAAAEQASAEQNRRHWAQVQQSLDASTEAILAQHRELTRQTEVLRQLIDSTGQLNRLEESLERNLSVLAESHHFEETVQSLAAVIHLLNARLGQTSAPPARPSRGTSRNTGQAA